MHIKINHVRNIQDIDAYTYILYVLSYRVYIQAYHIHIYTLITTPSLP